MATAGYLNQVYSVLDKATPIALVLLKTTKQALGNGPQIKDISGILYDLRQEGFRFRNLGLRTIPGGYYSEDVESFVGQLLSMGYATQRSPIKLTPDGEQLCKGIVEEEVKLSGNEVASLEKAIDQALSRVSGL